MTIYNVITVVVSVYPTIARPVSAERSSFLAKRIIAKEHDPEINDEMVTLNCLAVADNKLQLTETGYKTDELQPGNGGRRRVNRGMLLELWCLKTN